MKTSFKHTLSRLRVHGVYQPYQPTKAEITILDLSPYGESFQITDADGNVRTFAVNDGEISGAVVSVVQPLDKESK